MSAASGHRRHRPQRGRASAGVPRVGPSARAARSSTSTRDPPTAASNAPPRLCDVALALDPTRPFSAARARNEGFQALVAARPELRFVQFLDGDCTLLPGWLEAARTGHGRRCGACHRRRSAARTAPRGLRLQPPLRPRMALAARRPDQLRRARRHHARARRCVRPPRRLQRAGHRRRGLRVRRSRRDGRASRSPRSASRWPPTTPTSTASRSGGAVRFAVATRSVSGSACTAASAMRDCARERRSVLVWGLALPATIAGAGAGDPWPLAVAGGRLRGAGPADRQVPSRPGRQWRRCKAVRALRGHRQVRRGLGSAEVLRQQHGRSVPDHRIQVIRAER